MDPITLAALIALFGTIGSAAVNRWNNRKTNQTQKDLQEDAQAENRQNMLLQPTIERKFYEYGLLNDPSLQLQGLKAAGISDAAAAQAIIGAANGGWNPQVTSNGSPMASAPNQNLNSNMLQGLADAANSYFQNQNLQQETESNRILTTQNVAESVARIDNMARQLNLNEQQLDISRKIANSQIGLNESQANLNYQKLHESYTNIVKIMSEVELLDAQKIATFAQASLYKQEANYYEASTTAKDYEARLLNNQATLVQSQTEGQDITNLDSEIVLQLKNYRLEVSKALGCDIDAPLTTQVLEMMMAGNYEAVNKALEASRQVSVSEEAPKYLKPLYSYKNAVQHDLGKAGFKPFNYHYSSSNTSYWNPTLHREANIPFR